MKQPKWLKRLSRKCITYKHLWDILAALRGPDYRISWRIKQLTTARIRGILVVPENPATLGLEVAYEPLTNEEVLERNVLLNILTHKKGTFHFINHFKRALRALNEIGYKVPQRELIFNR